MPSRIDCTRASEQSQGSHHEPMLAPALQVVGDDVQDLRKKDMTFDILNLAIVYEV